MFISERREPLFPLAGLPQSVAAGCASDLVLRPFGLYESDLNVDFDRALRPFLITEILDCCASELGKGGIEPEFFWSLTVGKRIECLLHLLPLGREEQIPFTFVCPNKECSQQLEIEISIQELTKLQAQAYETEVVPVVLENGSLGLRRPTGNDQLAWLKNNFADEAAATEAMLGTMLLGYPEAATVARDIASSTLVQLVDQALEEFDPLVNFTQLVNCSSCGAENLLQIDLEEFSLGRLWQTQMRLLASVYKLAAHFHWTEREIFSVPYWRRVGYLNLINKEKEQ